MKTHVVCDGASAVDAVRSVYPKIYDALVEMANDNAGLDRVSTLINTSKIPGDAKTACVVAYQSLTGVL